MKEIKNSLIYDIFPKRDDRAHKGTYKKVLAIGGSKMMHGAIELLSDAAYRSGVGTLTVMIPDIIYPIFASRFDFAMIKTVKNDVDGFMVYDKSIKGFAKAYDIITIGNGLGRNIDTMYILKDILALDKKVIVDADALYFIKDITTINAEVIYTPHIKEMSYMINSDVEDIIKDPIMAIDDFIVTHKNSTVILKSSSSIIKDKQDAYILNKPNSKLAKGGSGDILCGILAGMWAQGVDALSACILASYIHNEAANITDKDPLSILPDDIIASLDLVYKKLRANII